MLKRKFNNLWENRAQMTVIFHKNRECSGEFCFEESHHSQVIK